VTRQKHLATDNQGVAEVSHGRLVPSTMASVVEPDGLMDAIELAAGMRKKFWLWKLPKSAAARL
jgi:hypothetical protein